MFVAFFCWGGGSSVRGTITADFLRRARRKKLLLLSPLGVTLVAGLVAITQGAYEIPLLKLLRSLIGQAEGASAVVVWMIRLPRIAASLVVGWGLARAGLLSQTVLRDPLCSPSTLGISQGAAFGASLAIIVFGGRLVSVATSAFARATYCVPCPEGGFHKASARAIARISARASSMRVTGMVGSNASRVGSSFESSTTSVRSFPSIAGNDVSSR
ncbi:MAG TPA: hypothetical protein DEO88_13550 [Syntrophobacteraceae bacterium]|nr:hypothetical protein [Syntrophobacteraceae bacterium]